MSEQILDVPASEPAAEETTTANVLQDAGNSILDSQPEPSQIDMFPEEFRVMTGDQLDVNATAAKLAEAYKARAAFGTIPANDEEYQPVEIAGGAKWEEVKELDAVKAFAAEAKKLGMTNEQFAYALKTVAAAEVDGRNYAMNHNKEASEQQLREEWKDPNSYDLNIKAASAAVKAFIPAAEQAAFTTRYGNDAQVIKLLAKIGAEVSEDSPLGLTSATASAEDVKSLMTSEAYLDSKHPEHAATMAKVQRFYAKQYGNSETL
ncbi:hypothetical protein [Leclercia sp. Marseille-Q4284]|uniref:hypothetical protein n=1 Tax=Leclercia sp. Marseille-Q4284 TaxID=2866582 RepID=UPI001CE43B7E|nr:hypothetical protein [Leclercia sp. Marseille-Q4284]